MRRWTVAAVTIMAAILVLSLAGCGDQTADANKAIDAANAQFKRYTAAGAELERLMADAQKLPMDAASSKENAKKAIALTDRMDAKLDEQRSAAGAARSELAKIAGMRVRQEFKTYADKEIAITDTLLKEDPVAKALIADLRRIYELVAAGKATEAEIQPIKTRIETESRQLSDIERQADAQEKDAAAYFDEKKLGGR